MRTRWRFVIISTLLCALPSQAQKAMHKHAVKKPIADSAWSELQSSMAKMHAAMESVDPSRDSDADFVRLMIPHHQAAIDMARTQLLYGSDPQMRRLAQEIITDQQSEIELMNLWLRQHGFVSTNVTQPGPVARRDQ